MPKKPLTPYFRYFLEKRPKYGKMHPQMTMTDLAKVIAAKFNEMSAKKKVMASPPSIAISFRALFIRLISMTHFSDKVSGGVQ